MAPGCLQRSGLRKRLGECHVGGHAPSCSAGAIWLEPASVLVDVAVANGSVQCVPLAGGSSTTLGGGLLSPGEIIVLGSTLYWSTGGNQIPPAATGGVLEHADERGCKYDPPLESSWPWQLAIDATHLAWIDIVDLASEAGGLFVMGR